MLLVVLPSFDCRTDTLDSQGPASPAWPLTLATAAAALPSKPAFRANPHRLLRACCAGLLQVLGPTAAMPVRRGGNNSRSSACLRSASMPETPMPRTRPSSNRSSVDSEAGAPSAVGQQLQGSSQDGGCGAGWRQGASGTLAQAAQQLRRLVERQGGVEAAPRAHWSAAMGAAAPPCSTRSGPLLGPFSSNTSGSGSGGGGGRALPCAHMPPAAVDMQGRFRFLVLRLRDGRVGQQYMVRGRQGASEAVLLREATKEVRFPARPSFPPPHPVHTEQQRSLHEQQGAAHPNLTGGVCLCGPSHLRPVLQLKPVRRGLVAPSVCLEAVATGVMVWQDEACSHLHITVEPAGPWLPPARPPGPMRVPCP